MGKLRALLKDKSGDELGSDYYWSGAASLILLAAVLGTLGYGYMWWKVEDARGDFKNIGLSISLIQDNVYGLDGKLNKLEDKLDITTAGVVRLYKLVDGNNEQIFGYLKTLQTPRRFAIDFEQASNFKDITKLFLPGPSDATRCDGLVDRTPKPVTGMSIKC